MPTAPPERIDSGLIEPAAVADWNAPDGFAAVVHMTDACVGGRYRTAFIDFANGEKHCLGCDDHDLGTVAGIVVTDHFDDPTRPAPR